MSNLWIHASKTDPMWGIGPDSVTGPEHDEHAAPAATPEEHHSEDQSSQTQPYVQQEKSDVAQHARNQGYQGDNPALVGGFMKGLEHQQDQHQTKRFLKDLRGSDPDAHAFVVNHMREQGHTIPRH